jgi:endonuclease-3 related protein
LARASIKKIPLHRIYRSLFNTFGPQHWWPGETPFEVAVGAILTQNTAWSNAERAMTRLKEENLLDPKELSRVPMRRLARSIRSSGFFNQKAKRLKIFVRYLMEKYSGDMSRMQRIPLGQLREELLSLSGIGPETADSILLYALSKPAFVVDAYTRRILARHSFIEWEASYAQIQSLFMEHLPKKVPLFNEYHALLVALGKELCLTHPKCHLCPLRRVGKLRLEKR